ncbi:MAG: hypothetical protein IAX21_00030 [Candidatus Bathyarchaeota archaeon]|nr:MAG: hypothetical protein IAX21_00030 [Candidatus Bathyarchaeota archaeon]
MKENDSNKINEIDAPILRNLLKQARTTFTEKAKEWKNSIAGVRSRFLKLKKIGIINGAIMQVNPYILGYDCMCDTTMKTAPENNKKLKTMLKPGPREPNPIGNHKENRTVATMATVGGDKYFETKSAKLQPKSTGELELQSVGMMSYTTNGT